MKKHKVKRTKAPDPLKVLATIAAAHRRHAKFYRESINDPHNTNTVLMIVHETVAEAIELAIK